MKTFYLVSMLLVGMYATAQLPCSPGFRANGTNDYIRVPDTDAINEQDTRDRTVEFWFKTSDITTKQVLYKEGARAHGILFFIEDGQVYCGAYRNNGNHSNRRRFFRSATGDITADTWYHIALTLENQNTLKWYLDGVEKDSQNGFQINERGGNITISVNMGAVRFPGSLTNNWEASSVGSSSSETYNGSLSDPDSENHYFTGHTSLLRIWNVARTQSEINTNKSTYLTSGTDLVAYLDGNGIEYEPTGSSTISDTALAEESTTTYTWTGGDSSSWSAVGNWSDDDNPDTDKAQAVVINSGGNKPEITTEAIIGNLTVDPGGRDYCKKRRDIACVL